jgi:hypothetical protein
MNRKVEPGLFFLLLSVAPVVFLIDTSFHYLV